MTVTTGTFNSNIYRHFSTNPSTLKETLKYASRQSCHNALRSNKLAMQSHLGFDISYHQRMFDHYAELTLNSDFPTLHART